MVKLCLKNSLNSKKNTNKLNEDFGITIFLSLLKTRCNVSSSILKTTVNIVKTSKIKTSLHKF